VPSAPGVSPVLVGMADVCHRRRLPRGRRRVAPPRRPCRRRDGGARFVPGPDASLSQRDARARKPIAAWRPPLHGGMLSTAMALSLRTPPREIAPTGEDAVDDSIEVP